MIIYIYENLKLVAKPIATSYDEFKQNPFNFYPDWNDSLLASEVLFLNPILCEGQLREKTREELVVLDNKIELLLDGEILSEGLIITIPKPQGYNIVWNGLEWIETITKQELITIRLEKMIKYADVEENKNKVSTLKFTSENEVKALDLELAELEKEINKISNDINSMCE